MLGDILNTVGDVQYRGEYHDKCGGYLEYHGTMGDIISSMGYLYHCGDTEYCEGLS